MAIPGMIMPTLSVEEINKQISDLKAVESWLTLNMNMLRSTIQALEVQSATIATLQAMSESLSAAVKPSSPPARGAASATATAAGSATSDSASASNAERRAEKPKSTTESGADSSAVMGSPAVWWNMLQDQFKQAVDTALASEKPTPAAKPTASKPQAKSVAKKTATPRKAKAPKTTDQ